MTVKEVLDKSDCIVDIYHKGQYVDRYLNWKDINNIEEWVLNSEVVEFGVSEDAILEIDSR